MQIHELPSARGCTYVVPSSDFPLALKVGQNFGEEADIQTAIKYLGVTQKEIDRLMDRIIKVLGTAAKDPRQLRESLGDAVRNLGETGKKRGWQSFVPRDKQMEKAVAKMQDFIRNNLGDARSFSLDSPESRAPRIASLRKS